MFDLNQQIARWRSALANQCACSRDELQELESHLREQIAALVAAGRSEQEAFSESASRLGDTATICSEFAKNERAFFGDTVALRTGSVLVVLVGLAAVGLAVAVGIGRGDGLLALHVGSITFAYVVPFVLAGVGTYAILRTAMVNTRIVQTGQTQFRNHLAAQCRLLLTIVALACAVGTILGGIWAEREWGRFWSWDLKEIGGLSVFLCALGLSFLVTRQQPTSVRLGQATLLISLVTFAAWFGPAVYEKLLGPVALILLAVTLMAQLAILTFSFFVPTPTVAEN